MQTATDRLATLQKLEAQRDEAVAAAHAARAREDGPAFQAALALVDQINSIILSV